MKRILVLLPVIAVLCTGLARAFTLTEIAAPPCPRGYTVAPGGTPERYCCVKAGSQISCAKPPPATSYNVSSTKANNVPVGLCYRNTAGECLYNTANPATATGAWNTGCPPAIAGTDCCGWKPASAGGACCKPKPGGVPSDCANPLLNLGHPQDVGNPLGPTFAKARCEQINQGNGCVWDQSKPECRIKTGPTIGCASPKAGYNVGSTAANTVPLYQCYKNTVGECLYNTAKPGTPGGWNTGCPPAIAGGNCCGWTAAPPQPFPATLSGQYEMFNCGKDGTSYPRTAAGFAKFFPAGELAKLDAACATKYGAGYKVASIKALSCAIAIPNKTAKIEVTCGK